MYRVDESKTCPGCDEKSKNTFYPEALQNWTAQYNKILLHCPRSTNMYTSELVDAELDTVRKYSESLLLMRQHLCEKPMEIRCQVGEHRKQNVYTCSKCFVANNRQPMGCNLCQTPRADSDYNTNKSMIMSNMNYIANIYEDFETPSTHSGKHRKKILSQLEHFGSKYSKFTQIILKMIYTHVDRTFPQTPYSNLFTQEDKILNCLMSNFHRQVMRDPQPCPLIPLSLTIDGVFCDLITTSKNNMMEYVIKITDASIKKIRQNMASSYAKSLPPPQHYFVLEFALSNFSLESIHVRRRCFDKDRNETHSTDECSVAIVHPANMDLFARYEVSLSEDTFVSMAFEFSNACGVCICTRNIQLQYNKQK